MREPRANREAVLSHRTRVGDRPRPQQDVGFDAKRLPLAPDSPVPAVELFTLDPPIESVLVLLDHGRGKQIDAEGVGVDEQARGVE